MSVPSVVIIGREKSNVYVLFISDRHCNSILSYSMTQAPPSVAISKLRKALRDWSSTVSVVLFLLP
jgi:hypothetical protein